MFFNSGRRSFSIYYTTLVSAGILFLGCDTKTQLNLDPQKPNIVFIVVDDLGASDFGCYGADLHETPNIDRFAQNNLMFTNSYAAAPVCSPSRASIMTGKYPARLNFTIWSEAASPVERKNQEVYKYLPPQTIESLPLEEVTIAEKLKEHGYLTAHIGKWHIGDYMHFPENQGFDVSIAASQRGAPPTYFFPYKAFAFREYRFVGDLGADAQGKYFTNREGEYLTDRLTDEALEIIEDAGDRPFFLNLWYYSVHVPLEAPEEDIEYFRKKIKPEFKHQHPTYAAMVRSVDFNVGRVLKKLEETGVAENTVIFLLSDNGGFVNKHKERIVTDNFPFRSGKGSLYEGGIRIPTIISLPHHSRSGRIDIPISTIDYFPTVMDLLGIKDLPEMDGSSILPLLNGEKNEALENRRMYWHYPHYYPTTNPVSAIRDGKWKLLEYLGDERLELYDLEDDISESKNLAEDEPEKAKLLLQKLHDWQKQTNARGVTLNPNYKGD